jgi:co-chaperonin GroES (HSP10)
MFEDLRPVGKWIILTDREEEKETKSGIQLVKKDPITESYEVIKVGPEVNDIFPGDIVTIPFLCNDESKGFPTKWNGKKIKFVTRDQILVKVVKTRKEKIVEE